MPAPLAFAVFFRMGRAFPWLPLEAHATEAEARRWMPLYRNHGQYRVGRSDERPGDHAEAEHTVAPKEKVRVPRDETGGYRPFRFSRR